MAKDIPAIPEGWKTLREFSKEHDRAGLTHDIGLKRIRDDYLQAKQEGGMSLDEARHRMNAEYVGKYRSPIRNFEVLALSPQAQEDIIVKWQEVIDSGLSHRRERGNKHALGESVIASQQHPMPARVVVDTPSPSIYVDENTIRKALDQPRLRQK